MPVELVRGEAEWVLSLSGVVDIFDAAALHGSAVEAEDGAVRGVVARLDDLEALDTSTMQLLLGLKRGLAADGRTLCVSGTPPAIAELWRLVGLENQLRACE